MDAQFDKIITTDNLAKKSIEAIIDLIRSGKLKNGERLPSQDVMAKMLGVSRTSLREALKELSYRGLIVSRHGLGTFVCNNLVSESETLEARRILEPGIARIAAVRADATMIGELTQLVEQMEPFVHAGSYDEFSRMDLEFHNRIVAMTGNPALERLYHSLNDMTLHQQMIVQRIPGIMKDSHLIHREIARALARHNPDEAEKLMADHLDHVYQALRSQEEVAASPEGLE
ncbi:MAG: FadR family transcriptional regulator [Planctomycetes bacterium]|nr:FadR family transcriptional regulator [Planctomycetota bacterium]